MNERDIPTALDELADLVSSLDDDIRPELCELLQTLLAPPIHRDFCARLEICPIHSCDLGICADDNALDCADYRN